MDLQNFYFKLPKLKTEPIIDDTTLRDGSQGEGVNFSLEDKLLLTRRLDEMGFDFIEVQNYLIQADYDGSRRVRNEINDAIKSLRESRGKYVRPRNELEATTEERKTA